MPTTFFEHYAKCPVHGLVSQITRSSDYLTVCPKDETHVCTLGYINQTWSDSETRVVQESTRTNGFYSCHGKSFIAAGCSTGASYTEGNKTGLTTHNYFRFEMPFTVLTGLFQSRVGMDRDMINLRILPQNPLPIGVLTQDANDDDTHIHVNSTVLAMVESDFARIYLYETSTGRTSEKVEVDAIDYVNGILTLKTPLESQDGLKFTYNLAGGVQVILLSNISGVMPTANTVNKKWISITSPSLGEFLPGRWINIFRSASNKSELRMIEVLDLANNRVRINDPFNIAMDPAAGPVYVQLTVKTINNVTLKNDSQFMLGQSVIGGSYIKNGIAIVLDYTRKSTDPIEVDYEFEIFC